MNKIKQILVVVWIVLFTFEDVLSQFFSPFSYIDESTFFLFLAYEIIKIIKTREMPVLVRENRWFILALALFVLTGLAGNLIYRYQPVKLVIIDLITNIKFFVAIAFFSEWIDDSTLSTKKIAVTAEMLTIALATLFLADRIFDIWPADIKYVRYGIKSSQLFYNHPTYLAAACAFLIAVMTVYNPQKYIVFITMNVVMMAFTLRSKAIVSAALFVVLFVIIKHFHKKLRIGQIAVIGIIGVVLGWSKIHYYFIELGGDSARSVMLSTSITIMKDYFPIGTGFATYASHSAAENYSPVYIKYGFENIYELRNSDIGTYFDDQFWPIIFGQTGVIGTIFYLFVLGFLFRKIQKLFYINENCYLSAIFAFVYILVSSIAEPAFNNFVAIPLAMVIAMAMSKSDSRLSENGRK